MKICLQLCFLNVFRIVGNLHITFEEPHFCIIFYQHCFQILFFKHLIDFNLVIFIDFIHNLNSILLNIFVNFQHKVKMDGQIFGYQSSH